MRTFVGLDLLDGATLRQDQALAVEDGTIAAIGPRAGGQGGEPLGDGDGRALVTPGLIDLQVNGGDGRMLGDCRTPEDVLAIAAAGRAGGAHGVLPTLISDRPDATARIVDLTAEAARRDPGVLGLHLEGPHLSVPGIHPADRLRPMDARDLALYERAAACLPHLLMTLAPDVVPPRQIARLTRAGVKVFLGHSAADHDTARAAFGAGATGVTHLFNAMSGLHHRAPGLAAAALEDARFIGLIADGHHVHPAAMRLAARSRPEAIFLVSDAMAVAGTRADGFHMEADWIARRDGRLTRADGTLAGADLDMAAATRTYADATGLDWHTALRAAFDTPYRVLTGRPNRIRPGARARLLVWQGLRLVGPLPD